MPPSIHVPELLLSGCLVVPAPMPVCPVETDERLRATLQTRPAQHPESIAGVHSGLGWDLMPHVVEGPERVFPRADPVAPADRDAGMNYRTRDGGRSRPSRTGGISRNHAQLSGRSEEG